MNSGSNANKTDDKEIIEVEAEMKINQTLKREFVLKTVEVELKAIKEANELKLKENKFRRMKDWDHVSPLPR